MMRPPPYPATALASLLVLLLAANTHGGCEFPPQWQGRWFQSGFGILQLNRSTIETKGECVDSLGDKFVVYDRSDDCYRCMVIHEKHAAVLQYKETYCDQKASLQELCYAITGDAPLYSMFRKSPDIRPVACPFKAAPFTFSYNRGGSDECSNPPSRAESCTDDSRLVLKYQACPDIQSTESNVEELVCVATWKEGSTRYLVGRLNQISRRSALSDEDQYRCFIYERVTSSSPGSTRVTYHVAQSGDATCNGLQSAVEGSRTMRLTTADTHHGRCRFPSWITDHHTWLSLDHAKTFKFSLRNATLRIMMQVAPSVQASSDLHSPPPKPSPAAPASEVRLVCHALLQLEGARVQLVAHVTRGCASGYVCMLFHKRHASVIEIQQPEGLHENPDDACREFDAGATPFTTLIAPALHATRCPHPGRYEVLGGIQEAVEVKRRKRQDGNGGGVVQGGDVAGEGVVNQQECLWHDYEALNVGCGVAGSDVMEFRSRCQLQPISAYTCHGSWVENNTHYLITSPVARHSTDALRYCLVYTFDGEGQSAAAPPVPPPPGVPLQPPQPYAPPPATVMRLSGLADSCHRGVVPGSGGLWRFNFTTNGGCTVGGETGGGARLRPGAASLLLALSALLGLHR